MSHICPYLLCAIKGHRMPGGSGGRGDMADGQGIRGKKIETTIYRELTALGLLMRVSVPSPIYFSSGIRLSRLKRTILSLLLAQTGSSTHSVPNQV